MADDENAVRDGSGGGRSPAVADRFSRARFLVDLRTTATALGAPYSEAVTNRVLDAYASAFDEGAVLWRTTDRPGAGLDYRFYARRPLDTMTIARRAGFIAGDDPLAALVQAWSGLYGGAPEQSCDFDAALGQTKTWVYLAGTRPLDDVLGVPGVPDALRRLAPLFHGLGLDHVRHVAVDYRHRSVNLYFRARGPVDPEQCRRFTALAGAEPPGERLFGEMAAFLSRGAYTFSVTLSSTTGAVERVAFYALKLPDGQFPLLSGQLLTFFDVEPSYDPEDMNAVAWSFGAGGATYVKAERSHCGDLVALIRGWNTFFSRSETTDPALAGTVGSAPDGTSVPAPNGTTGAAPDGATGSALASPGGAA
ncbi:aromatic prenyltransferase [Streptomyces bacillaris]|uniref:aromatic prenyltransferase n=1 Tax=Streptomyces bacillaris TaxID=68179 RepID=UPI0036293D8E